MTRHAYATPAAQPWVPGPAPRHALRRGTARWLRRLAAGLCRLARTLSRPAPHDRQVPASLPRLEYHAEAGAPEGALYVDGQYVGRLDVRRL